MYSVYKLFTLGRLGLLVRFSSLALRFVDIDVAFRPTLVLEESPAVRVAEVLDALGGHAEKLAQGSGGLSARSAPRAHRWVLRHGGGVRFKLLHAVGDSADLLSERFAPRSLRFGAVLSSRGNERL